MSKRFTDTEKWGKKFIRTLKPEYKLLWFYITDECNSSGIWDVDIDVAKVKIGMDITESDAIKNFSNKIILLEDGAKWFIPSFIEFQYVELSDTNRAHTKIIFLLKKYDLLTSDLKIKPLTSPLQGAKDKVKVKVKVKEEDKEEEKETKGAKSEILIYPFTSESFRELWGKWKDYRKSDLKKPYKSVISEQAALNHLVKLADGVEDVAKEIILQSLGNTYQGLFPLRQQNNATTKTGQQPEGNNAAYKRFVAAKLEANRNQG